MCTNPALNVGGFMEKTLREMVVHNRPLMLKYQIPSMVHKRASAGQNTLVFIVRKGFFFVFIRYQYSHKLGFWAEMFRSANTRVTSRLRCCSYIIDGSKADLPL